MQMSWSVPVIPVRMEETAGKESMATSANVSLDGKGLTVMWVGILAHRSDITIT